MKPFAIGIDLGGTVIKIGLVQGSEIVAEARMDAFSSNGLAPTLPLMEDRINAMLLQHGIDHSQLSGIGLAFPGLVDSRARKVLSTNKKYDDAARLDLQEWANQKWQASFFIDNDARMAAVGEWKFGAGKGYDNLVAVTIGTGLGSSAIIEGKLLRGKHYQAGVLGGHISLNYRGGTCTCGNIGCAEAEASTWNIAEKIKNAPFFSGSILSGQPKLDFEALFRAAKENDPLACSIKEECLRIWSTAVINLVHAYDPEVVVLAGGILASQDQILPYIQEAVNDYAWCPWGTVSVRASELHHKAAILGVTYCLQNEL